MLLVNRVSSHFSFTVNLKANKYKMVEYLTTNKGKPLLKEKGF